MKRILILPAITSRMVIVSFLLAIVSSGYGQLQVTGNTDFITTGNVHLVLADMDFYSTGAMNVKGSTFHFTGSQNTNVGQGLDFFTFDNISVEKTTGKKIHLGATINVDGQVHFISGNIDLDDKYLHLGSTGSLIGESEISRATSSNYGLITANAVLNAPNAVNIGNLGAVITSAVNIGLVSITRMHNAIDIPATGGQSIFRSYEISPTINTNLNATLTFKYFDAELNGLNENNLVQFKRGNNFQFSDQGSTTRDAVNNNITKTGYSSFDKFTLANSSQGPLPVKIVGFSAQCQCKGSCIQLSWKTEMEQNSDRFDIQRSPNGTNWKKIGSVKAAGNSNTILSYQYNDQTLNAPSAYYRLAAYDLDNKLTYSPIVKAGCGQSAEFKVIPNPVTDIAKVTIGGNANSKGNIVLYNASGQQVMQQAITITSGINQYQVNMAALTKGIYTLVIVRPGEANETTKIIKQ
ncbi:MAG: T9SS type A sorting domain-containing protein [Ferruginibacter sp.]